MAFQNPIHSQPMHHKMFMMSCKNGDCGVCGFGLWTQRSYCPCMYTFQRFTNLGL